MSLIPLLVATASADPPSDWAYQTVAISLHPVGYDYGAAYQGELVDTMAGPRASPVFNALVNEADVHWRLFAATGRGLDLPATAAGEWADLALLGSFLAFNRVGDETFARSEEVDIVRLAVDTVLAPSVDVVIRKDGKVNVGHNTGFGAKDQLDRREISEDLEPRRGHGKRRRFHLGIGWQVRDTEAPETDPLLTFGTSLTAQNFGISAFHAEVSFVDLRWNALARQAIIGDFSLVGTVRSTDDGPTAARWSTGVAWAPAPRLSVRFDRFAAFDVPDYSLMLTFHYEAGGRLPGQANAGMTLEPSVQDRTANRLGPAWAWAGDLSR